jgi:membrane protein
MMRVRAFLGLFKAAFLASRQDNTARLGASLAFYTLFAIAPVLLVSVGIAGLVFGPREVRGHIVVEAEHLVGSEGARVVQSLLQGVSERRAGVIATIVGSATFLIAASGAFLELQAALNQIWGVKPRPGLNLRGFLLNRARSFGLVVALGFLLLVSLAVSAALAAFASWLGDSVPGFPLVWSMVNVVVSLGVITLLFALLYRFLPDLRLRHRDVWVGALVTSILFTIGKELIGLYLGRSSVASSYGAAGAVAVLLLWVYYSSQIVLFGAEFTRVYARHEHARPKLESFAEQDPAAPSPSTAPSQSRAG